MSSGRGKVLPKEEAAIFLNCRNYEHTEYQNWREDAEGRVPGVISFLQREVVLFQGCLNKTAGVVSRICFTANILNQMFAFFFFFLGGLFHQALPRSMETDLD